MNLRKEQAIFYDFDGVLKESHKVKTEAIHKLFLPFGENIAKKAVAYHLQHGGVSRIEKIHYAYKHWIKKTLTESQLQTHATDFSKLVYDTVLSCPFVEGALKTIKYFNGKIPQYIITGTPEHEIIPLAKEMNIDKYFIEICGSPMSKKEHIARLMTKYKLSNKNIVFIGDASTDFDASNHHKLHFILRTHAENNHIFENYKGIAMPDLTPAIDTIKQLLP